MNQVSVSVALSTPAPWPKAMLEASDLVSDCGKYVAIIHNVCDGEGYDPSRVLLRAEEKYASGSSMAVGGYASRVAALMKVGTDAGSGAGAKLTVAWIPVEFRRLFRRSVKNGNEVLVPDYPKMIEGVSEFDVRQFLSKEALLRLVRPLFVGWKILSHEQVTGLKNLAPPNVEPWC